MKIFDSMLLDLILVSTPIILYLLYLVYTKTFNTEENELLIVVTLLSMLYLLMKYIKPHYNLPLFIINVPLILSYLKKNNLLTITLSIILIIYNVKYFNNPIPILEYLIYYILYLKAIKKPYTFILVFSIIKILITFILISSPFEIVIQSLELYIITCLIYTLLIKTYEVLKLHLIFKEIEKDKQIKTSLFQITHEIKNPIAVCKGYLDMFDENNKNHLKYIPIIKEEIDRTLLLLEDFLAMNKVKINRELIDINLLLEEVIHNTNMLCKKNNIKLINNIIDDEIYINADYNRLTQVIINLIKNSVEAIENSGKIEINEYIKNDQIIINIKDNGKGMNKELLNKIKEPFYTTKPKGTGLGVSLSEEIITAHDGTLNYTSKEGEYTNVKITLPLIQY